MMEVFDRTYIPCCIKNADNVNRKKLIACLDNIEGAGFDAGNFKRSVLQYTADGFGAGVLKCGGFIRYPVIRYIFVIIDIVRGSYFWMMDSN